MLGVMMLYSGTDQGGKNGEDGKRPDTLTHHIVEKTD